MDREKIKKYTLSSFKIALSCFILIAFIVFAPVFYGITKTFIQENFIEPRVMVVGPVSLKVRVVDNDISRQKGLSGTKSLAKKEGMFFKFDEEDYHGIWMKDMNYPIDIIWFNKYGAIIYIEENVSPSTYPKVFKPNSKSKYVLEVNSGFVKKNDIKTGDTIDLF